MPYSAVPTAFCETAAELGPAIAPAAYTATQWIAPAAPAAREVPDTGRRYAVLHVGASSVLKLWPAERWRALAAWLEARGLDVVWSAGPGEAAVLDAVDPGTTRARIAGTLSLPQLWHLLARARLLVCPDTGVAHLGRIVGVPTVTLFGPGSVTICGPGEFFAAMPGRAVTVDPFPCRDQTIQFFREVPWARRCERLFGDSPDRCPRARCMEAIDIEMVTRAIEELEPYMSAR